MKEPDYDFWIKLDKWSYKEAALLICGLDPDDHRSTSFIHKNIPLELKQAYRVYEILKRVDWRRHRMNEYDLSPIGMLAVAINKGIEVPKKLRKLAQELLKRQRESDEEDEENNNEKNYSTPLLTVLNDAINHFWIDYDPTKPPKKATIVDWIRTKYGVSRRQAEAIDLIIRPPERKAGGNVPVMRSSDVSKNA